MPLELLVLAVRVELVVLVEHLASLVRLSPTLVVAARYGQGYVVQLPNENLMWFNLTDTSMGRLIRNAVAWASGGKVAGMRVGALENGYAVVTRNLEALVRGCMWCCCAELS